MTTTTHLGITLLEQAQAQKEVTVNEAFNRIDALLNSGAIDKDLATPPSSPAQGDVYIVAASPTGAWSGKATAIAYFDQIWRFIAPNEGAMIWVDDENVHYVFNGTAWTAVAMGSGDMLKATYDPANIGQQLAGTTATQTLTNKTLTSPVIGTGLIGVSPRVCEGRLTLTSGTPVTTGDVTGAGTVYFTPYKGTHIALYDGSASWTLLPFAEISISLASGFSSGFNYDVFAYNNSGSVALETLVWTNDTTRATALALQNGIYVKSGATTRRYLGTFRTTAATTTEDSKLKRFVYNYTNRILREMRRIESTASWTYSSTTLRQANGSSSNQIAFVQGVAEDLVSATTLAPVFTSTTTARVCYSAIGLDTTAGPTDRYGSAIILTSGVYQSIYAMYDGIPAAGYHYLAWLEQGAGADIQTWAGNNTFGIVGRCYA
ncbi:MAG: DUF2793 domain-containing protein [Alphaproteobacteria bacterium]